MEDFELRQQSRSVPHSLTPTTMTFVSGSSPLVFPVRLISSTSPKINFPKTSSFTEELAQVSQNFIGHFIERTSLTFLPDVAKNSFLTACSLGFSQKYLQLHQWPLPLSLPVFLTFNAESFLKKKWRSVPRLLPGVFCWYLIYLYVRILFFI